MIIFLFSCASKKAVVKDFNNSEQRDEKEEVFTETYEIDISNLPREIEAAHIEPEAEYYIPVLDKKFITEIIFTRKIFCPIDELEELSGNGFDIVFNSKYSNFNAEVRLYKVKDEQIGLIHPQLLVREDISFKAIKKITKTDRITILWHRNRISSSLNNKYIELKNEDLFGEFMLNIKIHFKIEGVIEEITIRGIKTSSKPIEDKGTKMLRQQILDRIEYFKQEGNR